MMILVLVLVLCIFLFFVGGERGAIVVTTLAGNVCVLAVTIILLANGMPIFPIIFLATILISYITLIQQNGKNQKTWSALVSVSGIMLFLSVAIAIIVSITNAGGLNEIQSIQEDVAFYYTLDIQIPMQKIAVGIVILSALGAIMDTALSITSAVYEVSLHKQELSRKEYVVSGIQVGKDIIGTTANTLLFAYFGESILLFSYLVNMKYSWEMILNSKLLFQGLAMMSAGMIACLLAVPVSSYIIAKVISDK